MARNLRITVQWPTPGPNQAALAYAIIEARVQGAPAFTEITRIAYPATQGSFNDVAVGPWEFRGIVVDVNNLRSQNPQVVSFLVPHDAPPDLLGLVINVA